MYGFKVYRPFYEGDLSIIVHTAELFSVYRIMQLVLPTAPSPRATHLSIYSGPSSATFFLSATLSELQSINASGTNK